MVDLFYFLPYLERKSIVLHLICSHKGQKHQLLKLLFVESMKHLPGYSQSLPSNTPLSLKN